MFVGIICACTPAAARSYSHHLESLSALKIIFLSQLSRVGLSTKQSRAFLLSRDGGDRQPGKYSNIDIQQRPGHVGKAHQSKNDIQTLMQKGGKQHDLESSDGIHLTFEMQQSSLTSSTSSRPS